MYDKIVIEDLEKKVKHENKRNFYINFHLKNHSGGIHSLRRRNDERRSADIKNVMTHVVVLRLNNNLTSQIWSP